ncbi:hypothetical protein SUDANB145_06954 [Streptomyces sp. enrichment culture]|uniref:hypothetical protein n=1 Tax=Streptomyces sp. enrichment culture TaxID=1795815 RepID=UPI003F57192E
MTSDPARCYRGPTGCWEQAVSRGAPRRMLHALYQPRVTVIGGSAASCLPLFADGPRRPLARSAEYAVTSRHVTLSATPPVPRRGG